MKFTNKQLHRIGKILAHFGAGKQTGKVIEELDELEKAVSHQYIGLDTREHIIEEMADVYIMLEQLKMMHHITDTEVMDVVDFKLDRTEKKIQKESEK